MSFLNFQWLEASTEVYKVIKCTIYSPGLFFVLFTSGRSVDDVLVRLAFIEQIIKDANSKYISLVSNIHRNFGNREWVWSICPEQFQNRYLRQQLRRKVFYSYYWIKLFLIQYLRKQHIHWKIWHWVGFCESDVFILVLYYWNKNLECYLGSKFITK